MALSSAERQRRYRAKHGRPEATDATRRANAAATRRYRAKRKAAAAAKAAAARPLARVTFLDELGAILQSRTAPAVAAPRPPRAPSDAGELAARLADYASTLRPPVGAGDRIELWPWQAQFFRRFAEAQESGLSMGRGNGKTSVCAFLACAALDGPLAVPGADVVLVASRLEQARTAYRQILQCLGPRIEDRKRWSRGASPSTGIHISNKTLGIRCVAMAHNASGLHGLTPSLAILDEPAQWGRDGGRVHTALSTAMGKIPGSRLVAIGTLPDAANHWFAELATGDAGTLYQARLAPDERKREGWFLERRHWREANPSLTHMPHLADAVAAQARKAAANEREQLAFQALRLNLGTPETDAYDPVIEDAEWRDAVKDGPQRNDRDRRYALGVDIGGKRAMTCAAAWWPRTKTLEVMGQWPGGKTLLQRAHENGEADPTIYARMEAEGTLRVTATPATDVAALVARIAERWGRPIIAYADPHLLDELEAQLSRHRIHPGPGSLYKRYEGWTDGAEDLAAMQEVFARREVAVAPTHMLSHALANAVVVAHPSGRGRKQASRTDAGSGRRQAAIDDAVAAVRMAIAAGCRARRLLGPNLRREIRWSSSTGETYVT